MSQLPLKPLIHDLAEEHRVKIYTVYRWLRAGWISGVTRVGRSWIEITGPVSVTVPPQKPELFPWHTADWSRTNQEIASELGCTRSAVRFARIRHVKHQRSVCEKSQV
jgi:hypothetical protein